MANIGYGLRCVALQDIHNNRTAKAYRDNIRRFATWAKTEQGLYSMKSVKDPVSLVQKYVDYLIEEKKTAASVHSYIAPICKGFHISMNSIQKPVRGKVTKGSGPGNTRGQQEMYRPEAQRIITAAQAIGIRKSELFRLKGKNLVTIKGHLYVEVEKGKGGKYQLQRILPSHEQTVKEVFKDIRKNQYVFTREERKAISHVNIHRFRADVAKEAYEYYKGIIQEGKADIIQKELIDTFESLHKRTNDGRYISQLKRFCDDINKGGGLYRLRGENRMTAIERGRPVIYERLPAMAVSVFHLSHWRLDVTIKHYLNK